MGPSAGHKLIQMNFNQSIHKSNLILYRTEVFSLRVFPGTSRSLTTDLDDWKVGLVRCGEVGDGSMDVESSFLRGMESVITIGIR